MPNSGLPTIASGATGDPVRQLQRALRRIPNPGSLVDGVFGPKTETAVKEFQQGAGLVADGVVGPLTWAHPDGSPMPTLQEGWAVTWSAVCSRCLPLVHQGSGIRAQVRSMAALAPTPKHPAKQSIGRADDQDERVRTKPLQDCRNGLGTRAA
jgi:peptidoglycan hydrolase-like protein with peptidoglycan-binding domain